MWALKNGLNMFNNRLNKAEVKIGYSKTYGKHPNLNTEKKNTNFTLIFKNWIGYKREMEHSQKM